MREHSKGARHGLGERFGLPGIARGPVARLAGLVASALHLLACSSGGGSDTKTDASLADRSGDTGPGDAGLDADAGGPVITAVVATPNPNQVTDAGNFALSGTLTFTTDRPSIGRALIANTGPGQSDNTLYTPWETTFGTSHTVVLLGMRAASPFTITAYAQDMDGRTSAVSTQFNSGALPDWIPKLTMMSNQKTRTSPGWTMLYLHEYSGSPVASGNGPGSGIIAVDPDFQVVWYRHGAGSLDVEKMLNGDLLLGTAEGTWMEVDMLGNVVNPGPDKHMLGIPWLDNHALQPEPNGRALGVVDLVKDIPGYPAPDGGTQTYAVVGTELVEFPFDGGPAQILANSFEQMNPLREGNPQIFNNPFFDNIFKDAGLTKDWIHGNAIVVDPSDDNIVASSRAQSWIYKSARADGGLMWTLGYQGSFTLTNPGDAGPPEASWEWAQHGAYVTPSGNIMCFDDGENRPPVPGCSGNACFYSRAVEFSLDTSAKTATIVWEYGSPTLGDPNNIYTQIYGSSYVLPAPQGGVETVLVDDGCELSQRNSTTVSPQTLKSTRVIEVTHAMPPEVIAEFDINVPLGSYAYDPKNYSGFCTYRAQRLPSLYAGSAGSGDLGDL